MNQHGQCAGSDGFVPETRPGYYRLSLYIAGRTGKSLAALDNLQQVCEAHLAGNYEIEVVDLLQNPRRAALDQIVAIPTLLRRMPEPKRRIIGTLSDTRRLMFELDITPPVAAL
jgi:circadian clock protein KaiB